MNTHLSRAWTTQLIIGTLISLVTSFVASKEKGEPVIMEKMQAIVLGAGKSTRFNTGNSKLIEPICGQPMILYSTKLLAKLDIATIVVVGYQKELIMDTINKVHRGTVQFAEQVEQRGTGDAIKCSKDFWKRDHILILNGDMPLIDESIVLDLYHQHMQSNAAISFVTSHIETTNHGYGRVVTQDGITQIIEAKDFTLNPDEHCVINAGVYLVKRTFLQDSINKLNCNNKSNEFYITDLVKIASESGAGVSTLMVPFDLVRGINTMQELWAAEQIQRSRIIKHHMDNGVRFSVAQNVHVDLDVEIGSGSYIGCGAHLIKDTRIGKNCMIHENVSIESSDIGDSCEIKPFTIITESIIAGNCSIGPFAHIKQHSMIGEQSTIGNFVEIKESKIGSSTKAKHLAYIGNALIGDQVNIGAGTITCNHNGVSKHQTTISDNAYIGSNNTLIAPVTVGAEAYTAAGSVITQDVPAGALAIGRARQVNKEGYAHNLRQNDQMHSQHEVIETKLMFSGALKTQNDTTNHSD